MKTKKISKKQKRKISLKTIFYSKFFIIIGIIILIPICISLVKEIIKKSEINNEIRTLQAEIQEIERQNAEMDDLLKYMNSSGFTEKEAKEKFGLKEAGEKIVMIPVSENEFGVTTSEKEAQEKYVPNPIKWKNYFLYNY